jgi:hypothetical protein
MPPLTRWYLRAGLVWLAVALAAGVFEAWPRDMGTSLLVHPAVVHMLVVGWLTQVVFGVAHWMFPRRVPATGGSDRPGWTAWGLLNGGLAARVLVEPWFSPSSGVAGAWPLVLAALAQLAAGWLFVFAIWPRVRGR